MRNPPPPPAPPNYHPLPHQHPSLSSASSIKILLAQRSDIPELVEVVLEASRANVFQFFLTPTPSSLEQTRKEAIEELNKNFDREGLIFLKGCDGSGEIRGVGAWEMRGWGSKDKEGEERDGSRGEGDMLFAGGLLNLQKASREIEKRDRREELKTHILANFASFLTSWAAPTKHLYLSALFTHPKFQGRGIGSALLEYGHEMADREGIPCFLIGTPVGHPFYVHKGWNEIGEFGIDLKDWVEGGERGDLGWGVYKFWYMVRMPRTAVKK